MNVGYSIQPAAGCCQQENLSVCGLVPDSAVDRIRQVPKVEYFFIGTLDFVIIVFEVGFWHYAQSVAEVKGV